MGTFLVRHARLLVTMDAQRRELEDGAVFARDGVIEADILADTQRVVERWHNPQRYAVQRIVVAPCSPFSVSRELTRDAALLAR